jgi:hypothetical protein
MVMTKLMYLLPVSAVTQLSPPKPSRTYKPTGTTR